MDQFYEELVYRCYKAHRRTDPLLWERKLFVPLTQKTSPSGHVKKWNLQMHTHTCKPHIDRNPWPRSSYGRLIPPPRVSSWQEWWRVNRVPLESCWATWCFILYLFLSFFFFFVLLFYFFVYFKLMSDLVVQKEGQLVQFSGPALI